ncbi:hypothetical protein OE88DRAFT_1213937 [Heliocybe sulcata]|uniref:Uncharacterized protein n=1 Tax=Heliocybe sulcata TaxID=5364 RepID=A0A5C3MJM8_9AGAM|nr:hypothetical protein OE88DRAFT_1213937 [Heliocybe sulcata]
MDGCAGVSSVSRDWKDKGQKADLDGFGGSRDCARPALNGLGLNIPLSRPHSQSPLPHHANAYPMPNPCHSTSPPLSSKAHLPGPGPGFRLHAHSSYPTPRPDTQQPLHGFQVSWTTGHVSSSGAEQALMEIRTDGNTPDAQEMDEGGSGEASGDV